MNHYLSTTWSLLGNPSLLLFIKIIAFFGKALCLGAFIKLRSRFKVRPSLWLLSSAILLTNLCIELLWIIQLLLPTISNVILFLRPFGHVCTIVQNMAWSLFIDQLINTEHTFKFTKRHTTIIIVGSALICIQLGLAFLFFLSHPKVYLTSLRVYAFKLSYFYVLFTLIPTLYIAIRSLQSNTLPKIIAAQLKVFIIGLIAPHALLEMGSFMPYVFFKTHPSGIYPLSTLSTLLLTYAVYFSARRIMGLRFLNLHDHVETQYNSYFIKNFKGVLEQFAHAATISHIRHITYQFFAQSLRIPLGKSRLYIRNLDSSTFKTPLISTPDLDDTHDPIPRCVETMLSHTLPAEALRHYLYANKILIKDELEFTNFYEHNPTLEHAITFLNTIQADVFVPIYDQKTLVAYIIITQNARPKELFSASDRDEMLIVATYLGNIINLLQYGNFQALMHEQKKLKEELFCKHQEINQYKESIRFFLKHNRERKIGIIFYRNRKFSYGNQAAKELLSIDLSTDEGHELMHALKKVVREVQDYKSAQATMTHDAQGHKLVMAGLPSLENNYIIITVYYPEVADTLKNAIDLLKDPSEWDYLLYLETTQSGHLINQLIPGMGETLISAKIQLLKAALSKKAVLLDMADEDLLSAVEIIHHISLRSDLYTLRLTTPEKSHEVAYKLFGFNPLFGLGNDEPALLEKLDNTGTLFIENVDLLNLETQHLLAEYLSLGLFKQLKSDRRITSNVRIICSTRKNLLQLVQAGTFSTALLQELQPTKVSLPTLISLEPQEINQLMDGYIEQALQNTREFKNVLELSSKERERILDQKPLSIHELKEQVQHLLSQKSYKKSIKEITLDLPLATSDPELTQAIRLGKRALKDTRVMTMLWNKFKNQTKIAALLGVNRSSVNRRCKEYNLTN